MKWIKTKQSGNPDHECFAAGLNSERKINLYYYTTTMNLWALITPNGEIHSAPPVAYCVIPNPPKG